MAFRSDRDREPPDEPLTEMPRALRQRPADPLAGEDIDNEPRWPLGDPEVRGRALSTFSSRWLLDKLRWLETQTQDDFTVNLWHAVDAELQSRGGE